MYCSHSEGQQQPAKLTYKDDELWQAFRPKNLNDAWNFVSRVAKINPEESLHPGKGEDLHIESPAVGTVGE